MSSTLQHLEALVGFGTENPPRSCSAISAVVGYCSDVLQGAGCAVEVTDYGDGCVNLLALRGETNTVVNCHLDTVPADPSWTTDPFKLEISGDQAVGLGACDIKGAAACLLAAATATTGPLAILFTTDEEAGSSHCVRQFLASEHGFARAIVCEPTECRAVSQHRGIVTYELVFSGRASHASSADAGEGNALHAACRWVTQALDTCGSDWRMNVGVVEGGKKANVAASSAKVIFGMRPLPGADVAQVLEQLQGLCKPGSCTWTPRFAAPALAEGAGSGALAQELGVEVGAPVDFWTEGSLFAEAGLTTVVLGPGSIRQAHTAGEFVSVSDLVKMTDVMSRFFSGVSQ